jgi:tetratricopeptide (TPR) repeat protein
MIRSVLLFCFVLFQVHAVSAQPAQSDQELSDTEARALFSAAVAAYDAGRYDDALDSFERAYRRSGRAELLFNVGQCYDRLRRDEEAVEAFERFLAAMPNAENRGQVEARVRALREAIARRNAPAIAPTAVAQSSEGTATGADDPLDDRPSHRGRRIGLITTSAVLVTVGVILTIVLVGSDDQAFARSDVGTVFARGGAFR